MQHFATTDELASRYRVKAETIRTWARQGKIPSIRAGRRPLLFDINEVDRWIRGSDCSVDEETSGGEAKAKNLNAGSE